MEKPQTGDGPLSPAQGEGIDEEELVDRCQSGPTEAFEFLYERHKSNIFQLCRALLWRSGVNRDEITADAMDATQEVFLKALKSIRSFDKRSAFYTWLYRIAINVCKNIRRTWKSRRGLLRFGEPEEKTAGVISSEEVPDPKGITPDELCLRAEMRQAIADAFDSLSSKYRPIAVMVFMEKKRDKEIAAILNLPLSTLKKRKKKTSLLLGKKLRHFRGVHVP